jgi:DNA-binding PadR family transcriptional regulator/nitroreductase
MSYDISRRQQHGSCQERRHHHPDHETLGRERRHGRHGLHSGRKLSSADLQIVLLALLAKSDAHGYELIKSLDEISSGFYVPSPGMIYPSLTYLVEIGFADVHAEGNKKKYRLNEAGAKFLDENRQTAHRILDDFALIGSRMADAQRALSGERGRDEDESEQSEELRSARRELRTYLRGLSPAGPEEEVRVAHVLRNAISALRKEPQGSLDPGALLRAIAGRRSMGLSRLKPDAVDRVHIERMLEAANWAPSNEDTEPWRFTVFTGEGREKLAELFLGAHPEGEGAREGATKRAFAAPVWISLGMSPKLKEDGSMLMSEEEELMAVACAVQNLHLMASAEGLAGMWHSKGSSVHPAVARGLGLEPPSRLLGFFMCGWPSTEFLKGTRGPIEEKVIWVETA